MKDKVEKRDMLTPDSCLAAIWGRELKNPH